MGLGQLLFARLQDATAAAAVIALIGDRVLPQIAPLFMSDDYPMVVYELDERDPVVSFDGPSGLVNQNATLTCIGFTYDQAHAVADVVRPLVNAVRGTWADTQVQGCFLEDEVDVAVFVNTEQGEQKKLFGVDLKVSVWFAG